MRFVRASNRGFVPWEETSGQVGPTDKPFQISKQLVWEANKQVKVNKGAAGVDGQSIVEFEADLQDNLYKIWNRMSSGTYFPPAVLEVEETPLDAKSPMALDGNAEIINALSRAKDLA